MAAGRDQPILLVGFVLFSVLLGTGIFFVVNTGTGGQGGSGVDVEAYPVGPEKPSPLNTSTVEGYAVSYEERLLYNDLLASQGHHLAADKRVVTDCHSISLSNGDTGAFRVELACRGGIAETDQLSEPAVFTYSVTYRITETDTEQTAVCNYPFGADRGFHDERR